MIYKRALQVDDKLKWMDTKFINNTTNNVETSVNRKNHSVL